MARFIEVYNRDNRNKVYLNLDTVCTLDLETRDGNYTLRLNNGIMNVSKEDAMRIVKAIKGG